MRTSQPVVLVMGRGAGRPLPAGWPRRPEAASVRRISTLASAKPLLLGEQPVRVGVASLEGQVGLDQQRRASELRGRCRRGSSISAVPMPRRRCSGGTLTSKMTMSVLSSSGTYISVAPDRPRRLRRQQQPASRTELSGTVKMTLASRSDQPGIPSRSCCRAACRARTTLELGVVARGRAAGSPWSATLGSQAADASATGWLSRPSCRVSGASDEAAHVPTSV